MNEDPMHLRLTAETCRRLVGGINDAETKSRLTALADVCESKLHAITERADGKSQPSD
jgi:hypothetical protein